MGGRFFAWLIRHVSSEIPSTTKDMALARIHAGKTAQGARDCLRTTEPFFSGENEGIPAPMPF